MDESYQFIIESPQNSTGHKKRPRLVTSCDNCRLKKIKCLQHTPETKCEACKAAKIPCRFRDRERYFAERSRAIAGPNVASSYGEDRRSEINPSLDAFSVTSSSSSPSTSHSTPRSTSHSPKASGLVAADTADLSGRYQPYPTDPRRSSSVSHNSASSYHAPRNDSMGYNFIPTNPQQQISPSHSRQSSQQYSSRVTELFDPENPQFPHTSLMPHLISTFFEQFGAEYPFLNSEEVLSEFWDQRLSPSLANCIAGVASRYSNIPELTVRGLHNVAEAYLTNAKNLINSIVHIPTFDTLHALIILSWSEYKLNRIPGFRAYCAMVMRMALDLGLNDQNIQLHPSPRERSRMQATWDNILQLHLRSSSCR
ncbi:hypothetical protein BDN72DRAFT_759515 [Pluteus cervinus]|uniref:Uncharacterized protein n=1 Tax=Pluteus cervinus TaxID=181527 RepID=A0ACD3B9P2_9AGAR|nr:hypothetical protein BDN72DRAFT_759515 [Pluteus cervinus]